MLFRSIKNEENEEFKIDLKFFDTKIDLKINSDFVSFISNICNIIKIRISYLTEQNSN